MPDQKLLLKTEKLPTQDETKLVLTYSGTATYTIDIPCLAVMYTINQTQRIVKTLKDNGDTIEISQDQKKLIVTEHHDKTKITVAPPAGPHQQELVEQALLKEKIEQTAQNNTKLIPSIAILVSINKAGIQQQAQTQEEAITQLVYNYKQQQRKETPKP